MCTYSHHPIDTPLNALDRIAGFVLAHLPAPGGMMAYNPKTVVDQAVNIAAFQQLGNLTGGKYGD